MQNASALSAKEAFRRRLAELMQGRQTKQKELAEVLGIRAQTVSQYITGRTTPDYDILRQIAQYYGVTLDWLLGASEYQSRETEGVTASSLGLSEKAIRSLRTISELEHSDTMQSVNLLLGRIDFYSVCLHISTLRDAVKEAAAYEKDYFNENHQFSERRENGYLLTGFESCEYQMGRLNHLAEKMLEDVTGYTSLQKEMDDQQAKRLELRMSRSAGKLGAEQMKKIVDAVVTLKELEDEQHP